MEINTITSATINKFDGNTLEYTLKIEESEEDKKIDNVDTFILATGVTSNSDHYEKVKASNPSYKIFNVGDSKEPRTMAEAVHEGFEVAYNLDK